MRERPDKHPPKKRREHERFQVSLQVAVVARTQDAKNSFILVTENISRGGALLRSEGPLSDITAGSYLELWIYLKLPESAGDQGDRRIWVSAEIVHIQQNTAFGVRFLSMPEEDVNQLTFFIEQVARLHPHRVIKAADYE
jgi:c-di-GMP-binding flagellar brake protein YcgR